MAEPSKIYCRASDGVWKYFTPMSDRILPAFTKVVEKF
jgi:hypothetical protein